MDTIQRYFNHLVAEKADDRTGMPVPTFDVATAQKLLRRIEAINLHAHTYSFNMNFKYSGYDLQDLMNFAYENGLNGVGIHIDYGKGKGLRNKSIRELEDIERLARQLNLEMALEISNTAPREINQAVRLATVLGIRRIRLYIVHGGRLSSIMERGIRDLAEVARVAEANDLTFVLESHEALKAKELVRIIETVASPRIKLLFDFGNMINANEYPLEALAAMAPHIRHAHIKGVCRIRDKKGFGHLGVLQGEDDLPQAKLLFDLLMLGGTRPQVSVFALEQVVGYRSRGIRHDKEGPDPLLPRREPSQTEPDEHLSLEENLRLERRYACEQVVYVKNLLERLKTLARIRLETADDKA
ncbi:MAG: sugar phosphate isomerase/epimerase [Desulfobacteraceae bacterium]|nr:sugar phosphate isomerase/epimerase [Desulfobacteraceae bacterium]